MSENKKGILSESKVPPRPRKPIMSDERRHGVVPPRPAKPQTPSVPKAPKTAPPKQGR